MAPVAALAAFLLAPLAAALPPSPVAAVRLPGLQVQGIAASLNGGDAGMITLRTPGAAACPRVRARLPGRLALGSDAGTVQLLRLAVSASGARRAVITAIVPAGRRAVIVSLAGGTVRRAAGACTASYARAFLAPALASLIRRRLRVDSLPAGAELGPASGPALAVTSAAPPSRR